MSTRNLTQARRLASTEYRSIEHVEEFSQVVDSLGRIWDALKHPRDRYGRFIRTFSDVKFNLPGDTGEAREVAGSVQGIDRDGSATVQVTGVPPGVEGINVGDLIKVNQKDVAVQTIKAKLGGKGAAGTLNSQETRVVQNRIKALQEIGLDDQAAKLSEALDGALAGFDLKNDPEGAQKLKDDAIAKFREVAEELDDIRGEGYDEGQSLDDVKADLTSAEKARLEVLRESIDATFTARHSLGDKSIDAQSSEGAVPAKGNERRLGVGQGRVQKAYVEGAEILDGTGEKLVKTTLQAPVVQAPIGEASTPEKQFLPNLAGLAEFSYQKLRSGLNRSAGWRQAQRVAPGDRFTVDKNGDQVIPGATVMYTPSGGGDAVTGMVTNVALDASGNQTVTVRRYDPEYQLGNTSRTGKPLPYKDHRGITSGSIELADEDQQHTMFKNLALQGDTGRLIADQVATALAEDAIAKLQAEAGRRYAESGAKRTSPVGAIDAVPIHDRVRKGANGEAIGIGDHVALPGGLPGVVTYVDPTVQKSGTGTVKVMYPDGQVSPRLTSAKFTKIHDPSSEVAPGDPGYNDSNYVPTREQAAADADEMGATSVAEAIRNDGDMAAIQLAMSTDGAFQDALRETPELAQKRAALQAGQEMAPEDADKAAKWSRMTAAAQGQFRDDEEPTAPEPLTPPEPEDEGEFPQNPANPSEHVSPGGTPIRENENQTIVDDDIDNPIDSGDTEAIEAAVEDADATEGEATPPAEPAAAEGVAHKVARDLSEAAGGVDYLNNVQQSGIEKRIDAVVAAVEAGDGEGFVEGLVDLTKAVNQSINSNLRGSRLHGILNRGGGEGRPLHELMRRRLDAGDDLFGGGAPVQRAERAEPEPSEIPDGVPPEVDAIDTQVSEGALSDDGSVKIMVGDQEVTEGFYVANQSTITEYEQQPTAEEITDFLNETAGSDGDGISISYDEATGRYQMARVGVFDNEQDAADYARTTEANQYVNIADGSVMNVALDGDPDAPAEAVEDPRSEERAVRKAGAGKAAARSTTKQKAMLDHVAEASGDEEIARISEAVKNGEEISGADASRLADAIDGMGADQFDKPSDKGVASQMAHKLARAAGEEGARGYSSQATALRRSSDVGIALTAASRTDEMRALVDGARADVKGGDNAAAAAKFRAAADLYDEEGHSRTEPSTRAREHADRLEAMGGVTAPAAEGELPEVAPEPEIAPEGGEPEADLLAEVNNTLGSVDHIIDIEGQASGREAVDDVNAQLGLIRGRVTSEGPYTELSQDLRDLADGIGEWPNGSDYDAYIDELNATADALDAAAGAAPQGETPGGEGGGGQPFRLDVNDVGSLVAAFSDKEQLDEFWNNLDTFVGDEDEKFRKLLGEVRMGSFANAELNRVRRASNSMTEGARSTLDDLYTDTVVLGRTPTPERVGQLLRFLGEDQQKILDIMAGEGTSAYPAENINEFMAARMADSVARAKAEADEATENADAPFDMKMLHARMEADSEDSALRRENGQVGTLGQFEQLVTETAVTLNMLNDLRDPANRVKVTQQGMADISRMAKRLSINAGQANAFFEKMMDQGINPAPFEGVLREQLAKFGAEDILTVDADAIPLEVRLAGNESLSAYRDARLAGKPTDVAAVGVMEAIREQLVNGATPNQHDQLSAVAAALLNQQLPESNGMIPEAMRAIFEDPVFARYGAFNFVLARMDMEDMAKDGLPEDLRTATNGLFTVVEWEQTGSLAPELTVDDRPGGTNLASIADEMYQEAVDTLTPNVASALTSLFSSIGGSIHRTPDNIAEAQTPEGAQWREDAENWRSNPGSDDRSPAEVGGVYSGATNTLVISDKSVLNGDYSPVVTHELGHALDSMLGGVVGGVWFSGSDPKFKELHDSIKETASYDPNDPNASVLFWYFRNGDEGSIDHNGHSGTPEIFAQGLSVYSSAIAEMNDPEAGTTQENIYWKMGQELAHGTKDRAMSVGGMSLLDYNEKVRDIGKAVFEYYDDLEKNRLPTLMSQTRVISTRQQPVEYQVAHGEVSVTAPPMQVRATPAQRKVTDTHNSRKHGVIPMTKVERGTPEWDQFEAQVKQVSPGASMPGPTAIYVTWNPKFAEQGGTVIWKAVMGGTPKHTAEYTDEHKATQLAAKFQRQQRVNTALDVAHAKAQAEAQFDETAALVLAMIETGMRVGSSEKAGTKNRATGRTVKTYGGATMLKKHVFFPSEGLMRFKFPGKANKLNTYESRNPALRAAVIQLLEGKGPSDQVFAGTNSGRSLDYLREATGIDDIINHDTRTRFATNMARSLVAKWPKSRMPKNEAALKKAQTEISKKVGLAINDTWTVARDSYISPAVWEPMEDSAGLPHSFDDSPPYGLIEGEVVQSIGGPPVGGPVAPEGEAPAGPAPVAAALDSAYLAAVTEEFDGTAIDDNAEPEAWTLPTAQSDAAERAAWYATFVWPDPPIVAGPDTTFSDEDGENDEPEPEVMEEPVVEEESP